MVEAACLTDHRGREACVKTFSEAREPAHALCSFFLFIHRYPLLSSLLIPDSSLRYTYTLSLGFKMCLLAANYKKTEPAPLQAGPDLKKRARTARTYHRPRSFNSFLKKAFVRNRILCCLLDIYLSRHGALSSASLSSSFPLVRMHILAYHIFAVLYNSFYILMTVFFWISVPLTHLLAFIHHSPFHPFWLEKNLFNAFQHVQILHAHLSFLLSLRSK
jgi:hypothetical protein